MLIGEFESRIGDKNRIAIPKRFRDELEGKLIITRGYENTLILVDEKRWKDLIKTIEIRPLLNMNVRDVKRFLVGGAFEIEIDTQGRFVLNVLLKNFAEIKNDVVFVGIDNWIEIWSKERWIQKMDQLSKSVSDIAERLSEIK